MNGWNDVWMDELVNGWIKVLINRLMIWFFFICINVWINGWINGLWMDGWMYGWKIG